jgi:hypothetical protein
MPGLSWRKAGEKISKGGIKENICENFSQKSKVLPLYIKL